MSINSRLSWKPRPPSFPSDDRIPYTAAEVNEFDDLQDLNIQADGQQRKPSEDDIDIESVRNNSRLFRARDSVFVRQKQRNSIVSTFDNSDEESSFDNQSARNVKFRNPDDGIDNEVFEYDEEEVVFRRKTVNSGMFNMDEPTFEQMKQQIKEEQKAWDVFKTVPPPDDDETLDGEWIEFFIKCLKIFAYFLTFVVTLGSAVLSKSLILLMTSMIRVNRTIQICNHMIYDIEPEIENDKHYNAVYNEDDPTRVAWIWCLFFAVIAPEVFAFGRSFRICYFKTYQIPRLSTFLWVMLFESCHSIGLSLLVFLILPTIDAINGSMMTNSMCLIPGILLLLKETEPNNLKDMDQKNSRDSVSSITRKNDNKMMISFATVCQLVALVLWPILAKYIDESNQFWCIPISMILISMCWWENFISKSSKSSDTSFLSGLRLVKKDLDDCRYFTYAFVSIWKIIVVFVTMIAVIYVNNGTNAFERVFTDFFDSFDSYKIELIRNKQHLEDSRDLQEDHHIMTIDDPMIPVWVLLIQIVATYLCYAFAKFSCKIHIQTVSFAIPVHLVVPITVSFIWAMVEMSNEDSCTLPDYFHGFQYIFWYTNETTVFDYYNFGTDSKHWYNLAIPIVWCISLFSQIVITIHIWRATSSRLATTEELFVNPMYNSVLIDQSLAMNRRRLNLKQERNEGDEENVKPKEDKKEDTDDLYESVRDISPVPEVVKVEDEDETVRIFVCATMWHENKEEMIQMLKAVMRLDADQFNRGMAREYFEIDSALTDFYKIEFNIYFDDAFDQGDPEIEDDRSINRFVRQLIETMDEAASNVHGTIVKLLEPTVVPTPYGGKLEWTLPGQNKLVAHLKDKLLIRHRKRWSQCMYMYYLLGHRIAELPIDDNRKERIAMNTFILALDGDINFRPQALHLVVDLMKKNKRLGAACGRIHPIGSGPMVWYQKFEYAIGHWLQKATEHVFGCVLCSPGCFSLFRARAVMDDSVMNKYTTKPSEALHYVQYDQGEDRWLCTLLLQQGWRIEYCAASDSYTHAPEGFGEFYTQRRRWAPSTMANIMDLLGDYKRTVERNTDISKPYILYQAMLMLGTVLSPGTIFLMVVGAMNTVMNFDTKYSLLINIVPILLFSIICLVAKKNDHIIFVAMILSTVYALLMLAVLVGTAIDIKDQGPWTPNSIFFMGMMASFLVAAILHPQEFACVLPLLLYMLLIPSMYLLLTIYSVTNMHVVSWGTREVKATLTKKEMDAQAAAELEAAEAKKNKKSRFGFLNLSHYGSKSGIFTCMCCSNSKSDEDTANLLDIKEKLNRVYENVDTIKTNFDQKPNRSSIYRRKSFGNTRDQNSIPLSVTEEEEEDDAESISETTSLLHEPQHKQRPSIDDGSGRSNAEPKPRWTRDKVFDKFPYKELSPNELQFWNDFLPKYLLPLDENLAEQKRILNDLKELRNRAVFAFGIINVIFILFVYLLQMHKDVFGIHIISGVTYNKTYNDQEDKFEDVPIYKFTIMDPIGLVLVVFFGAILIVQLIGMFIHRFGTLAQLLAVTNIDFFDAKAKDLTKVNANDINKNLVRIVGKIQRQGVREMTEQVDKNARKKSINPLNRRQSVFQNPQATAQPLNLNEAFRKRIMSINPEEAINLGGLKRAPSIGKTLMDRRKTMDWGRAANQGGGILRLHSQLSSQQSGNSRTPSVSSFNPPTRPKSITFQMPELIAGSNLAEPRRGSSTSQSQQNSPVRTLVNPIGTQPKVLLTPETPINEGPPTGQHGIFYLNAAQHNMANNLSNDIIRNSLIELKKPEPKEENISNDYQMAQTSSAVVPQIPDSHNSNDSDTNSSVSSNIDFTFLNEPYVESDSSGGFPLTALHPTTVQMNDNISKDGPNGKSSSGPKRISFSDQSDELSTRL